MIFSINTINIDHQYQLRYRFETMEVTLRCCMTMSYISNKVRAHFNMLWPIIKEKIICDVPSNFIVNAPPSACCRRLIFHKEEIDPHQLTSGMSYGFVFCLNSRASNKISLLIPSCHEVTFDKSSTSSRKRIKSVTGRIRIRITPNIQMRRRLIKNHLPRAL